MSDLVYFNADLLKEETNIISIEYDGFLESNNFGFTRDYKIQYSLFPSKYWKSFGPININLELPKNLNVLNSSIGEPYLTNGNVHKYKINKVTQKDLVITLTPKISLLSKTLIAIQPLGLAIILTLVLIGIHFFFIKKHRREKSQQYNWFLPIGIVMVPVLFYTLFLLSFNLIDLTLGENALKKHGYIFLIVLTLPIFMIIYSLLMWRVDVYFKSKLLI